MMFQTPCLEKSSLFMKKKRVLPYVKILFWQNDLSEKQHILQHTYPENNMLVIQPVAFSTSNEELHSTMKKGGKKKKKNIVS